MRDKLLGAAAGRPLLVVAALTIVLLLIVLSGATRNLPLDLLTRSYSAPEEGDFSSTSYPSCFRSKPGGLDHFLLLS